MAKHYLKLSKILQKLLYEKRINTSELAREVDLPVPTVHRLVTGKSTRPYKSSLKPIADFFGITTEQLLGEKSLPFAPEQTISLPSKQSIKAISIIEWLDINNLEETNKKGKKDIIITGNVSDNCFALLMNDYSMEPVFPKKSILIFDPNRKAVDRSYVLVKLSNNEIPIFRQLLVDIDHQFLKPLNPDLSTYQMRALGKDDTIIACLFESRINYESDASDNFLLKENML